MILNISWKRRSILYKSHLKTTNLSYEQITTKVERINKASSKEDKLTLVASDIHKH